MTRPGSQEDGAALVTVVGVTFVLTMLVAVLFSTVLALTRATYRDADFHAALGAAEAGLDDLLFQLNTDPMAWERWRADTAGNPAAPTAWIELPGDDESPAAYRYQAVSTVTEGGAVNLLVTGRVGERMRTLEVTLRRRSFLDYLYFTDYETRPPAAYQTWPPLEDDNEDRRFEPGVGWVDGNLDGNAPVRAVGADAAAIAHEQCSHHRYSGARPAEDIGGIPDDWEDGRYPAVPAADDDPATPDGRNPRCHEPHWTHHDLFDGLLHTNDAFPIRDDGGGDSGAQFLRRATSSWLQAPPERGYLDIRGVVNGVSPLTRTEFPASQGGVMTYALPLNMPPNNSQLLQVARNDGCVLAGPTRLHLTASGDVGMIAVNSPGSAGRTCGGVVIDDLGHGQVPVNSIGNGVLYVENLAAASDDAGRAADLPLEGVPGLGIPDLSAGLGNEDVTPYNGRNGDALVSGTLAGRLTIGAEHDIIIVDHVRYASTPSRDRPPETDRDLLGLIAERFVYLFNPVHCWYWWDPVTETRVRWESGQSAPSGPPYDDGLDPVCLHGRSIDYNGRGGLRDPEIHAAVLAVDYSLTIQNSGLGGSKGRLYVVGTIGQRYRGNLGTAPGGYYLTPGIGNGSRCGSSHGSHAGVSSSYCSAGYTKNFVYDDRLAYLSPPHFLEPLETAWDVSQYAEVAPEDFE